MCTTLPASGRYPHNPGYAGIFVVGARHAGSPMAFGSMY